MADLVMQEAYHDNIVDNVSLTQTHDLIVAEAYHDNIVDNVSLTQTHDLIVAEAYHLHTTIYRWVLVVADSGHAMRNTICTASEPKLISTPWEGVDLPTLSSTGTSDTKISCLLAGMNLPVPALTAKTGASLDKKLPTVGVSATATHVVSLSIESTLPVLTVSARSGITCKTNIKLPTLEAEAEINFFAASLTKTLPGLRVSGTGYRERTGSLSKSLPTVSATGTAIKAGGETGTFDKYLPPVLVVSATASEAKIGSMTGTLPTINSDNEGIVSSGASATMISKLPSLYFQSSGRDIDTADDYIMRYVR